MRLRPKQNPDAGPEATPLRPWPRNYQAARAAAARATDEQLREELSIVDSTPATKENSKWKLHALGSALHHEISQRLREKLARHREEA